MVLARRLTKLEEGLDPEAAVVAWLDEVQGHASIDDWLRSLGRSTAELPLVRIPRRLELATRERLKGRSRHEVERAVRRDVGEGVFRVRLVLVLNEEAAELIRHEGLRVAALWLWLRELYLREELAGMGDDLAALADAASIPSAWGMWRAAAAEMLTGLRAMAVAREGLEARYLSGHPSLFPERAAAWAAVVERADDLSRWGALPAEDSDPEGAASREAIDEAARARVGEVAEGIVLSAARGTHEFVGETRSARALVENLLASMESAG